VLEKPPGWEVDQDKVHQPFREDDAARLSGFMCLVWGAHGGSGELLKMAIEIEDFPIQNGDFP
jgi:hypothetical protein